MFPGAPSLADLWYLGARHHGAMKGFGLANLALWSDPAIRRTARHGIAVLAAMLRRLLHLIAREITLPPLRVRTVPEQRASPVRARKPSLGFRLTKTPRERTPRAPLGATPLPAPQMQRLPEAFRAMLQFLDFSLAAPDTS